MTESDLIKRLAASAGSVPPHVPVLGVRRYSSEDLERRAKQFIRSVSQAFDQSLERGDWTVQKDRTLIRLQRGARAVVYHASGAMKVVAGLRPMENLFPATATKETLTRLVETVAERLKLASWVGPSQTLKLERLWQIKASATDRSGQVIQPVICRAVGAYRQNVGGLPVLGVASAAVKIANDGLIDTVTLQVQETTPAVIDTARVLAPEIAARQIVMQLSGLMGKGKVAYAEVVGPVSMRLGYLSLGKRKPQPALAPVYVASLSIVGEDAQAYVLVTPATERPYLALGVANQEAPLAAVSRPNRQIAADA
jgi:hypothetical protein